VIRQLLPTARRRIRRAHCRVGAVRYARSANRLKNRVLAEKPRPKTRLRAGARVRLVVGRGRR
jgi:beta-lactam-binding protein with PASTA domain